MCTSTARLDLGVLDVTRNTGQMPMEPCPSQPNEDCRSWQPMVRRVPTFASPVTLADPSPSPLPCLPLHVAGRVCPAALERYDVVDDAAKPACPGSSA